jgi:acetylornithine deacetylase
MTFEDGDLRALHRTIVAIPSVSGNEAALADFVQAFLGRTGVEVLRIDDDVVAVAGQGPTILLNSHLDTVPPAPGWTMPPFEATVVDGRVFGLGSNDAKAPVAAMIAAFMRLLSDPAPCRVVLTLVAGEETGGRGTEHLVPRLKELGLWPDAVVVGEPTDLEIAVAQKGLMVLELRAAAASCHAANRRAMGLPNPIVDLARDLVALAGLDLGEPDPYLGPITVEPTVLSGGTARNVVPAEASSILDVRVNPRPDSDAVLVLFRGAVRGQIKVLSDRLRPVSVDPGDPIVKAALAVRPSARTFGSRGLSDWVFFNEVPGIKVGPGRTERSHTADEFVQETEVTEGARFYEALVRNWAAAMAGATGEEP